MKSFAVLLLGVILLGSFGCMPKKPEAVDRSQIEGQVPQNPHGNMQSGPGLDLESMLANLPEGWTKVQPSSSMRLAELSIAPSAGDSEPASVAFFHFPGTGGDAAANIIRWQRQMEGPGGEPGTAVAKTDTMTVYGINIITTDITGTQLPGGMGMGPESKMPDYRMIASVLETGAGNWFIKITGPKKTVGDNEAKIRDFLKSAKLQGSEGA